MDCGDIFSVHKSEPGSAHVCVCMSRCGGEELSDAQDLKYAFGVNVIDGLCGRNKQWVSCVNVADWVAFD